MHMWSDKDFDWKQLYESIEKIDSYMRFWGRIGVISKEKFGTARICVTFWDGTLHGLLYPGYFFSQFPRWLWSFDLRFISPFTHWVGLSKLVNWYQKKIYAMAYSRAIKAFPKIKIQLVIAADFEELIKEYPAIITMHRFRRVVKTLLSR